MTGMNWLITASTSLSRPGAYADAAAYIELRACPPAPGHARVEIPGERSAPPPRAARPGVLIPAGALAALNDMAEALGVPPLMI